MTAPAGYLKAWDDYVDHDFMSKDMARYSPNASWWMPSSFAEYSGIDAWIDSSHSSAPVRGLPRSMVPEIRARARQMVDKYKTTSLRGKELGISAVYRQRQYTPSVTAPCDPECEFEL